MQRTLQEQQRLRRKRGFSEYESTTTTPSGVLIRLRNAEYSVPLDEQRAIPSAPLRQAVTDQMTVMSNNTNGGRYLPAAAEPVIDVTEATQCPSFIPFGAQTMRADVETLNALVRFGYTSDLDWKRLTIPERLCVVESLIRFPNMPVFDIARFVQSLYVTPLPSMSSSSSTAAATATFVLPIDTDALFALYIFVAEGLWNTLQQRLREAPEQLTLQTSVGGAANPMPVTTASELIVQFYNAVDHLTRQAIEYDRRVAVQLLAAAYVRWIVGSQQQQEQRIGVQSRQAYALLLQTLAKTVSDVCHIGYDETFQFLQSVTIDAFDANVAQTSGSAITVDQILQRPQTQTKLAQLLQTCSASAIQNRVQQEYYVKIEHLVDYTMAQALAYMLQSPRVHRIRMLVTTTTTTLTGANPLYNGNDANNPDRGRRNEWINVEDGQQLDALFSSFSSPSLAPGARHWLRAVVQLYWHNVGSRDTTSIATVSYMTGSMARTSEFRDVCLDAGNLIEQTLTPWMWELSPLSQDADDRALQMPPLLSSNFDENPSLFFNLVSLPRQVIVDALVTDPTHGALKEYLIAQMEGRVVSDTMAIRAMRHVHYLATQWREQACTAITGQY